MSEKTKKPTVSEQLSPLLTFTNIIILLVVAAVMGLALWSYHPNDPAWSHNEGEQIQNTLGIFGAWYSDISFSLIGRLSYLLPLGLAALGIHFWLEKGVNKELLSWRLFMLLTAILSGTVLLAKHDLNVINSVAQTGGGALGAWLVIGLEKTIKSIPVIMAFSTLVFAISVSLLFAIPWLTIAEWLGRGIGLVVGGLFAGFIAGREKKKASKKVMTSTSVTEDEEDNRRLQEKIAQLNALAGSEKKRPAFTIDRYTSEDGEDADFNQAIQTPPPSMADQPAQTELADTDQQTETKGVPETDDLLPLTAVSAQQPSSQQSPSVSSFDRPVSETTTVTRDEFRISDSTRATASGRAEKTKVNPVSKQEKAEPVFFDFGRLGEAEQANETTSQWVSQTEKPRETIEDSQPAENDLGQTASTQTTPDNPLTQGFSVTSKAFAPTESISTTEPTTSAQPTLADNLSTVLSTESTETDTTVTGDHDVIEPSPELLSALQGKNKKPEPVAEPKVVESTAKITEPVARPQAASTLAPESTDAIPADSNALSKPQAPATTSSNDRVETSKNTVSIGKAYDISEAQVDEPVPHYELPGSDLLDTPPPQTNAYTEDVLAEMAGVLERTLKQFNVEATVMHVSPGPVITRFEIDLAPGIQAKKITNLSNDLARALAVSGVRVEEVIPGNSYVGLEVPNKQRQIVYFKDVVRSKVFQSSQSPLTVSLGSDTSGRPVVADLMKMPHALVAGTTGSGKSVCINVMLLSMLFKATPKELRLILVDPKMLEMSMYEDIPHLLTPVITDMTEAENALTWAVAEMERRYQLMAALKVRKIDAFNQVVEKANECGEPLKDPLWEPDEQVGYTHHPTLERLPFIVIVIDELADMMMVVGKQVEQLIARLTQKARAAGIHVVLATQRPSTDVLTGLIKANVPTRIAFQVSSGTDSRVIIDGVGAEKLLGHGDMLYVPPGAGHPQRLHGAFIGDSETDRITDFIRSMGEPDYIEGITAKQSPETLGAYGAAEAKEDADELYPEAVQIVLETGKASISSVQRHLRIGYNRAARMIEDMQEQGIVSEPVNGVRKVLGPPPKPPSAPK